MKQNVVLLFALLLLTFSCSRTEIQDHSRVNPLIGDLSSRLGKGLLNPDYQPENERVRTHLAFAEYVIRHKDASALPAETQAKRTKVLDLLRDYWQAGTFPGNYDYPGERRPCFVDQTGNICAVGYLVEQTAGRTLAEAINSEYQYAEIADMDHPVLEEWIAQSGLTKSEIAMIQPTYGSRDITTQEAATSMLATGIGTASSILCLKNPGTSKWLPAVGVGIALYQTGKGYAMLRNHGYYWTPNPRRHSLAMFNLGVGATNLCLNAYSLLRKRPRRAKATSINVFGTPLDQQRFAMGLSLSKRF